MCVVRHSSNAITFLEPPLLACLTVVLLASLGNGAFGFSANAEPHSLNARCKSPWRYRAARAIRSPSLSQHHAPPRAKTLASSPVSATLPLPTSTSKSLSVGRVRFQRYMRTPGRVITRTESGLWYERGWRPSQSTPPPARPLHQPSRVAQVDEFQTEDLYQDPPESDGTSIYSLSP